MASWIVSVNLFTVLVCIASSSVILSPEQGSNHSSKSLQVTVPGDITSRREHRHWNLSSNAPIKANTSLMPAEDIYNSSHPNLVASRVKCAASTYGYGLNVTSCQEAWALVPMSTIRITIGLRTDGYFNIPLPFRVLSREYDYSSVLCD